MRRFTQDTATRYNFLKSDRERPVLAPEALFLSSDALFEQLKTFPRLALTTDAKHPDFDAAPDIGISRRAEDPLAKFRELLMRAESQGGARKYGNIQRIILCTDSHGRRETIVQMLAEHGLSPDAQTESVANFLESDAHFGITVAPLATGFVVNTKGLLFLTENDLYPGHGGTARRGKRDQERASNVEAMVRDLSELREGDPVVHAQHGIGRYHGLVNLDMGEGEMEFLFSNTPTRPRCMCLFLNCTSSRAIAEQTLNPLRCTYLVPVSGTRHDARPLNKSATPQPSC